MIVSCHATSPIFQIVDVSVGQLGDGRRCNVNENDAMRLMRNMMQSNTRMRTLFVRPKCQPRPLAASPLWRHRSFGGIVLLAASLIPRHRQFGGIAHMAASPFGGIARLAASSVWRYRSCGGNCEVAKLRVRVLARFPGVLLLPSVHAWCTRRSTVLFK